MALHRPHLLDADFGRLAAVICMGLLPEPRMLQSLLRSDTASGVIYKNLGKEV